MGSVPGGRTVMLPLLLAAVGASTAVQDLQLQRRPGHLVFRLEGTAPPRLSVHARTRPFRVELDWFGSRLEAEVPTLEPGFVRSVVLEQRRAELEPVSRLVVECERPVSYRVRTEATAAELWLELPAGASPPAFATPAGRPELPASLRGPFPLPDGLAEVPGPLQEPRVEIPEQPPRVALERPMLVALSPPPSVRPELSTRRRSSGWTTSSVGGATVEPRPEASLPRPRLLVEAPPLPALPAGLHPQGPLTEPREAVPRLPAPAQLEPLAAIPVPMSPTLRRPEAKVPARSLPTREGAVASAPEPAPPARSLARFSGAAVAEARPAEPSRLATFAPPARPPSVRSASGPPAASPARRPPPAPPAWQRSAAQPSGDAEGSPGRRVLTYIGFQQAGATSRVFMRLDGRARFRELPNPARDTFVLQLQDTDITIENNTRPLDTSFFPGPVRRVQAKRIGAHVHVEVRLRSAAKWKIKRVGTTIAVDFVDDGA